jgi:hypothetical protein
MSSFIQNTIILGGVLVLLGLGYYLYTEEPGGDSNEVSAQIAAESAAFLSKLNQLKAIELDETLFYDPRFRSLVNYSVPVVSEPIGDANPFQSNN